MPLLFIGSGVVLVFVGLNGNAAQLYGLVTGEFQGANSFVYWMLAILVLGALGYIKGLEGLSKLFLILVIIVLLLDNGGVFAQFQAFLVEATGRTPKANAQGFTPAV